MTSEASATIHGSRVSMRKKSTQSRRRLQSRGDKWFRRACHGSSQRRALHPWCTPPVPVARPLLKGASESRPQSSGWRELSADLLLDFADAVDHVVHQLALRLEAVVDLGCAAFEKRIEMRAQVVGRQTQAGQRFATFAVDGGAGSAARCAASACSASVRGSAACPRRGCARAARRDRTGARRSRGRAPCGSTETPNSASRASGRPARWASQSIRGGG